MFIGFVYFINEVQSIALSHMLKFFVDLSVFPSRSLIKFCCLRTAFQVCFHTPFGNNVYKMRYKYAHHSGQLTGSNLELMELEFSCSS